MATSTTFPTTDNQLWVASNGRSDLYFADVTILKRVVSGLYPRRATTWEEHGEETSENGEPAPPLPGVSYPCSGLKLCTFSHWYGAQYIAQIWSDTGWRVWRQR